MEVNGPSEWRFLANQHLIAASSRSVRKVLGSLINSLGKKMKGMPSFSATATLPSSPASEPRSLLKTPSLARIEGWLARFPMFDWVGGRTSEMSAVGLLPIFQDMVILPYKDSLLLFSRYLQQLVMESLGKEFDLDGNRVCVNQGISSMEIKEARDRHAYIQQPREVCTISL
ncbi:hypothetical protein K1719_003401 [Acacia pycnantha]|nr:hypothetical protein K1719_003401 [Acacia pycnantha]